MNATLQCRENLDLGLPVPGLPFPPHHSPCRLNLSLEVGVGQIRNAWARGSLCESTTGWVQSQQPPLAALSVTLVASTPSQEAAQDKRAFTPPPPALPRISSSTSSSPPPPISPLQGMAGVAQGSPQRPGITLPASQLLPPVLPPHCETNDTGWTLDRNLAYQGVPGR